jgi:hypothetical protein
LTIISFIFQATPTELIQHKSELSFYVPPSTQVSNEPTSTSKTETISDEEEDHSSTVTESFSTKKQDDHHERLNQVRFFG